MQDLQQQGQGPPGNDAEGQGRRAEVQQGIAAALGQKAFVQIKVTDLSKYVGEELSIPGSF